MCSVLARRSVLSKYTVHSLVLRPLHMASCPSSNHVQIVNKCLHGLAPWVVSSEISGGKLILIFPEICKRFFSLYVC